MAELLLEVGLEEIPARMIADAQAELARRVEALLGRQRLLESVHGDHQLLHPSAAGSARPGCARPAAGPRGRAYRPLLESRLP